MTADLATLATDALVESKRWPRNWGVEMTEESMNYDGQPPLFRCWSSDGRTGGTVELSLGSEDYDAYLAKYIATMNTREPLLAAGCLDLTRQLAEANRELERWRHGVTIEGDFVCPDSLALSEALRANADLTRQLAELRDEHDGLLEDVILGPLKGATAHDAIIDLTRQLAEARRIGDAALDHELRLHNEQLRKFSEERLDLTRQLAEARAEIERLRDLEQSAMESWFDQIEDHKGTAQQLAAVTDHVNELRTRLAAVEAARDEACDFADVLSETFNQPLRHVDVKLIAELRAVGAKP